MSKYYRRPQVTSVQPQAREAILARVPWRALLLGALIIMSLVYLWLVNGSAANGFEVSRLEEQQKSLNLQYSKIQQELAEAQSLDRLAETSAQFGLVPVEHVEYVSATSSTALR